jgi:thymidylate kinase
MTEKQGCLFVIEGPDDVGKTTLASMLSKRLSSDGCRNEVLSFPGSEPGTISELIYRFYHNPTAFEVGEISPVAMQVLMTAAHAEVIEAKIKPLITAGVNIVLDRYWWSTWVYATVEGVPRTIIERMIALEKEIWGAIRPEIIFLILRRQPFLKQPESRQWSRIVDLYIDLMATQQHDSAVKLVHNEGDPSEAVNLIVSCIPPQGITNASRPKQRLLG